MKHSPARLPKTPVSLKTVRFFAPELVFAALYRGIDPCCTGNLRPSKNTWIDSLLDSFQGRLSYYIGGETMTLCHLEHPMYMLGYLPKEDRVYLMDKQQNIYSYRVRQAMLQYQVRGFSFLFFAIHSKGVLFLGIPSQEGLEGGP